MQEQCVYRYYAIPNTLFINIVERYSCLCECTFCFRPRSEKEYGIFNLIEDTMGNLYLENSPGEQEIMQAIQNNLKSTDTRLCFTGLGEPLIQFNKVISLIKKIKNKYNLPTVVETCGLAGFFVDDPHFLLEKAGLSRINISVNAVNEIEYNKICKPVFEGAFRKLIDFAVNCNNTKIDTYVSFVTNYAPNRSDEDYLVFAESLGFQRKQVLLRKFNKESIW